jgi:hypothetical protein
LTELTDRLRTAYEGWAARHRRAALSLMDPDIEWDATDALAQTGVYQGHEGVTEYMTRSRKESSQLRPSRMDASTKTRVDRRRRRPMSRRK